MQYDTRTDIIVMILFGLVALLVPTAIVMRHFLEIDPLAWLHIKWGRTVVGVVFALLATAVAGLNFFLTFLAPWLHRRRHGNLDEYHNVSGLPVIGNFFIFCAGTLLPPSIATGVYMLALYGLDTGGLPWFFYAILSE